MKLFLCGDVMTGRGVDQILPHPSDSRIYEPVLTSAKDYVALAEDVSGPIPRPVDFAYIWGDALDELRVRAPDLRAINLETSVTTCDVAAPKGINYRMHPANVPCLVAAGIDCCVLANNHVLDWGSAGLQETVSSLSEAGIATAGAGRTADEAARPAVLHAAGGPRVLIFAYGATSSGIPPTWGATSSQPGINLLPGLSEEAAERVASHILSWREEGDQVVLSLHWGENWGYEIPSAQRQFARQLIDAGAVDVIHGHSSHHVKGIEVYGGRLILYGCGDFVSDYEGIGDYDLYRPHLVLAYFASLDRDSGRLKSLAMVPFQSRRFRLERVKPEDTEWVQAVLNREGRALGTSADLNSGGALTLRW